MWEDFYNDNYGEYEQLVDDLKESLKKQIKDEYVKEMTRLKKENEELQEVKKNFDKIKQEYKDKEDALKRKEDNLNYELAHKKFNELTTIGDFSGHIYVIDYKEGYIPKCDKCDENRQIHFTSPTGRDCKEACPTCGKQYCIYYPKPIDAIKIRFSRDPYLKSEAWAVKYDSYGDSTTYKKENIYKGTAEEFNIDDYYILRHTCFESKELAQKICDRINKQNKVPDNVEIK